MRHWAAGLAARWFALSLPRNCSPATVAGREQLRKARLLSIGVLAAVLLGTPLILSDLAQRVYNQVLVLAVFEGVHVAAAILNRRGRVGAGSLVYIFGYIAVCVWSLLWTTGAHSALPLWAWVQLLLPSIFAGMFLPFWTPLLFGLADGLIVTLIVGLVPANRAALAVALSGGSPWGFSIYVFVMMAAASIISAVNAYSVERAVQEADRAAELAQAHAALAAAHRNLAAAYAQAEALAIRDPVTGLLNHRALNVHLALEAERAARTGQPLAIVFADLDYFKQVNDTWGHAAGDLALAYLSAALVQSVRATDVAARYGGEEFVLLLPGQDREQARATAERLCAQVAATPLTLASGATIALTISMGVAVFPDDAPTCDAALIAADSAMYQAKRNGRNRVCLAADVPARAAA